MGFLKSLVELAQHRLIGFEAGSNLPFAEVNWLFERAEARSHGLKPFFKVNSLLAMRTAVKQGMGIALMPEYLMYRTRHISRVLEDLTTPATEAYFIYPVELKNSKRVNVFRNFLQQKIAESSF